MLRTIFAVIILSSPNSRWGQEWLFRLIIEPRRLWKRYLIGNPLFLWRVLKQRFGLLHLPEEDGSEGSSA